MDQRPISLSAYWRLVRENRNFRLLWAAQIISELGDWLYAIAIYSLLLEVTGSAAAIALAVVLQELPQCLAAPAAGVLNDRLSRKRIMIAADLARAVIVLLMMAVLARHWVSLVYVLLLVETMMWAFFEPARNSVIPNIASGRNLLVANALSSTTWSVTLAIGSAVGGAVAVAFGRNTVFLVNAASFLVSAALVRSMRFEEPHLRSVAPLRVRDLTDFRPLAEGVRYVARDWRMLATMLVKSGLGFVGTSWVILPVLGERYFPWPAGALDPQRGGMLGMSLLMGARGVGALLGPIVASLWAGDQPSRLRRGILYGFLANAAGYLLLGWSPSIWPAMAAVILSHAGGSTAWVFSTTLLQQQTDDRFRGRVFSADYAFMVIAMSAVSYTAGSVIDQGISAKTVAILTGVAGVIPITGWALVLSRWERRSSVADHRDR
jgi:MFS family permease